MDRSSSSLHGEDLVLAALAREVAHFLADSNFSYLRKCANSECVLFFYDTTKNHRRQWCSTAVCGNRHKVAAFRERQARKRRTQ
jgi:predicted RNA-binding Zn ribbon-like protein